MSSSEGSGVEALIHPSSVAVVGATPRRDSIGNVITLNLTSKFRGTVYLVNPRYSEINGVRAYPSIKDIGQPIDLAVIAVPAPLVPSVMREAAEAGVRAAIIISGGFSEVGESGAKLEEEVRLAKGRVRVLGPNCIGVYNASTGLDTFFLPEDRMGRPRPGPIALISQSGAVAGAILDWAARRGLGIGVAVNYGNKLDVTEVDLMKHLASDPSIKVITMYMEGFKYPGEGRRFMEAAKEVSARKPVVVYKAGRSRSSRRAVASHTAALAGNYEVYSAAFRQAGLIEASSVREVFDMAKALATQPLPRGRRVLVLTDSGGMGVQATDALESLGLSVPELPEAQRERLRKMLPPLAAVGNPIDLTGSATDEMYRSVIDEVIPTDSVDMAMIIALMQLPSLTVNLANYIIDARRYGKPMVVVSFGGNEFMAKFNDALDEGGVPVYATPDRAAKALWALAEHAGRVGERRE
ncbi:CoA-binding protein [Thermocladium modestius]|uniref:CoA-binding protein n=1 Tax=Thermocladium modestius TaxID=62609 RepID=A0A830GWR0_9CREN|nr:CoA-binding protein [Thermocladium modestius]GGP21345.1 CoA-binding protein [Thermocladium modestius]